MSWYNASNIAVGYNADTHGMLNRYNPSLIYIS